jgi:hypothetical protein
VDFARNGVLATTSDDGKVRRYSARARGYGARGYRPYDIAFSPDRTGLAVGYDGMTQIDLLDGHTLAPWGSGSRGCVMNGLAYARRGQT